MLILIFIDVHIYRKLFLALKEVRMVKITPQNPPAKFVIPPPPPPNPLTLFGKPCILSSDLTKLPQMK